MNPEIKGLWVTALRSGDYIQGAGCLYDADRNEFCCLGVLSELSVLAGVVGRVDKNNMGYYGTPDGKYENALLSREVVEWSGLPNQNPMIDGHLLAAYNDGFNIAEKTFAEIADLIEEYL